MSDQEVDRYAILMQVKNKTLRQREAAQVLKISTRQVRNLLNKIKLEGKKGIISKKRGAPSNHQLPTGIKEIICALIHAHYHDFGPTLTQEKLKERHSIQVSVETVRSIMIEHHFWFAKQDKKIIHQRREPRKCFGEMIQGDSSPHDWFEGRREKCSLVVLIDDATSCLTALHFSESECLDAYFKALEQHILEYGRPRSLYTDRHAIFKTTRKSGKIAFKDTQLKRALKKLDIDLILARSPQAKGRVEKANRTLQDRLIKEMRLREINTLDVANAFLPEFIRIYNKKFGREPSEQRNVHRPLLPKVDLKRILCPIWLRAVSKDLTFQYKHILYQLKDHSLIAKLRGKKVEIKEIEPGVLEVWYESKRLAFSRYDELPYIKTESKESPLRWQEKFVLPKESSHPWKNYSFNKWQREKHLRSVARS